MKNSSKPFSLLLIVSIGTILLLPVADVCAQKQSSRDTTHRYVPKIKQKKGKSKNKIKLTSQRINRRNGSSAFPINTDQHGILKSFSSIAYGIPQTTVDGNIEMVRPVLVEPTIDAHLFIDYVDTINPNYDGIRILPGLTTSYMIVPIICLANRNTNSESNFIILDQFNYDQLLPIPVDTSLVRLYLERFKATVLIFNDSISVSRINLTRYYPKDTLALYFNANIDAPTYDHYKVKIEIGYVPEVLSEEFDRLVDAEQNSDHVGFTVMFHIIDPQGMPVIHPFGQENEFQGKHLEVGSPCPPLCGEFVPSR